MNTTQGFWIKEPIDIRNKKTGPYNVNFIYKQGNVFIMPEFKQTMQQCRIHC